MQKSMPIDLHWDERMAIKSAMAEARNVSEGDITNEPPHGEPLNCQCDRHVKVSRSPKTGQVAKM